MYSPSQAIRQCHPDYYCCWTFLDMRLLITNLLLKRMLVFAHAKVIRIPHFSKGMTTQNTGLSNQQQAIIILVAFVLVPISTWAAIDFPTDRTSLGVLTSSIIAEFLLFFKEWTGVQVTVPSTPSSSSSNSSTSAIATFLALLVVIRRILSLGSGEANTNIDKFQFARVLCGGGDNEFWDGCNFYCRRVCIPLVV